MTLAHTRTHPCNATQPWVRHCNMHKCWGIVTHRFTLQCHHHHRIITHGTLIAHCSIIAPCHGITHCNFVTRDFKLWGHWQQL